MEYSFDINSETEKFEPYYLKCICAGRAHEGFYIVYPSKNAKVALYCVKFMMLLLLEFCDILFMLIIDKSANMLF